MKKLILVVLATMSAAVPGTASAATFLFNAGFTYRPDSSSDGDSYAASGRLEANQTSSGDFEVIGATGEVTSNYGLRRSITGALPDFNDQPSSFSLNSDGSVNAADLLFRVEDFDLFGIRKGATGNVGFFSEVGGELTTLSISASAGAVPEPATWTMMLVGFGSIGGAMRYRRRRARVSYATA